LEVFLTFSLAGKEFGLNFHHFCIFYSLNYFRNPQR